MARNHVFFIGALGFEVDRPGDGDDCGAVGGYGGPGNGGVGGGDAVNFFSVVGLIECQRTENRGQDHSRSVDIDEVFVELDAAASGLITDTRSADGVVGGCPVHDYRERSETDVDVASDGVSASVAWVWRSDG